MYRFFTIFLLFIIALFIFQPASMCTPVTVTIVEPTNGSEVPPSGVTFTANFNGTTDTTDLVVTLGGVEISKSGPIFLKGQYVNIKSFSVIPPVVTFEAFGLPVGDLTFTVSVGGGNGSSNFTVNGNLNAWERSFYLVNYINPATDSPLIRYNIDTLTAPVNQKTVYINGAIALDRVKGIVYGGFYSVDNNPIRAFEAITLTPIPEKDIVGLSHSGSIAVKVNVNQRVLYYLDTVAKRFWAYSINDSNYGALIASKVFSSLKDSADTDIGDTFAIDHSQNKIFSTNGDGGPIIAIDISGITYSGGNFGNSETTPHSCRSIGNSGGMVAIDELNGRVFTFFNNNTVRAFSSKSPYVILKDYILPLTLPNDCGAWYDWRKDQLYIGSGSLKKMIILNLFDGKTSQIDLPSPHGIDGISLSGPAPF